MVALLAINRSSWILMTPFLPFGDSYTGSSPLTTHILYTALFQTRQETQRFTK